MTLSQLQPGARFRVVGRYFTATGTLLHLDQGRARVRWDGGAEHVAFESHGETVEFTRQRNRDDDAALTTPVEVIG